MWGLGEGRGLIPYPDSIKLLCIKKTGFAVGGCKFRGSNITKDAECSRWWQYPFRQRFCFDSQITNACTNLARVLPTTSLASAPVSLAMAYSAVCMIRYICSSLLEAVPRPVGTLIVVDQDSGGRPKPNSSGLSSMFRGGYP